MILTGKPTRPMVLGLSVALAVGLADQGSKALILGAFLTDPTPVPVTPFFNLLLTWNRGVSFGLLNDPAYGNLSVWLLTGLALSIVAALLWWLRKAETGWLALAFGAIVGGALGNVIDRLRFEAVVDFLDFHLADWHWPAFNVADSAIVTGAAIIVIDALIRHGESR